MLLLVLAFSVCGFGWHDYKAPCDEPSFESKLNSDTTTLPSTRSVELQVPFSAFRTFWLQTNLWPTWNGAYNFVANNNLSLCEELVANFTDVPKPWNPGPQDGHPTVVWQRSIAGVSEELNWKYHVPGVLFGRHDTVIFSIQNGGATVLYSWEKAIGPEVDSFNFYFRYNFDILLGRYFTGASCLETVYRVSGKLDPSVVLQKCKPARS